MKIITIADLHGKSDWEKVKNKTADKIVFLGDYVDSFTHSNVEILHNLNNIIQFKNDFPDLVELLIGNHEVQYIRGYGYPKYGCSGYRTLMMHDLGKLFDDNKKYFNVAYEYSLNGLNYIWTHAGITNKWFKDFLVEYTEKIETDEFLDVSLSDKLNIGFEYKMDSIFQVSFYRGGISNYSGILWADYQETKKDMLNNWHQIVGHTRLSDITIIKKDIYTSITYLDCLDSKVKFYTLDI